MLRFSTLLGAVLALAVAPGCGTDAPLLDVLPAETVVLDTAARNLRELVGCVDGAGKRWLAAVDVPTTLEETTGRIVLLRPTGGEVVLAQGPAVGPVALCALGEREVFAVWEAAAPGGRALFGRAARETATGIELGDVEALPSASTHNLSPAGAPLGGGVLRVAWQALVGEHYRVQTATRAADGTWSASAPVSEAGAADQWLPRVGTAPDALDRSAPGPAWIAFDTFQPGSPNGFDVALARQAASDAPFTVDVIAGGPRDALYPELAVESNGRAWVAFEEVDGFGTGPGLREARALRLLAVDPDGRVQAAVLPPELAALQRADFPKLHLGPEGIAITRRLPKNDFVPRSAARQPFYATWHTYLLRFQADGTPLDIELTSTGGDNENETAGFASDRGLELFTLIDKREATFDARYAFDSALDNPARVQRLTVQGALGFPKLVAPELTLMGGVPKGRPLAERAPEFLFGDLHRHTSLSRCAGRKDGTFVDAMRYARGPGALDFIAVTDHFQHVSPGSLWRQKRDVERYHAPGSLIVLPGLERMVMEHSHQNLIWPTVDELTATRESTEPEVLVPGRVVAIPHMTAIADNGFDLGNLVPALHRAIEIHQGLRGSYEGRADNSLMPDDSAGRPSWPRAALNASNTSGWIANLWRTLPDDAEPPGLISSSDHSSSAEAFAGVVLAPDQARPLDREALFARIVAGETFATTGPVGAPHGVSLARQGAELVLRAPGAGASEYKLFENGQAAFHSESTGATLLQLKLTTGPQGDGVAILERKRDAERFEELGRFGFGRGEHHALAFDVGDRPARDDVFRVRLDYANDEHDNAGLLTWGQALDATQFNLVPGAQRPILDVYGFGAKASPVDGELEQRFDLSERPAGALYYARLVHPDGNVTWSRMVRGR